jgi:hypothetical protein
MLTSPRDETRPAPLPDWASPPTAEPVRSPTGGMVLRVVIATLVGAGLLYFGHRTAAIVLATVFSVVTVASLVWPAVPRAIDRLTARFQHLVGRTLTVVLLGAIFVVVFLPVWLVLRILRHDPIALGATPNDPSFWHPVARHPGRTLHRRPFAHERRRQAAAPRRRAAGVVRLRTPVVLLLVLAALDLAVGAALLETEPEEPTLAAAPDDTNPTRPAFTMPVPDVGAREGEPWAQALFDELALSYDQSTYHPFRGWTVPDFAGTHVNVVDEVRRSYAPRAVGGVEPIEVAFFGGSTTMGWFQRDEHTIPSVIARLAEADGISLRVVNYGQPAYQNWQEVLLLQEVVSRGDVPDLAVFYDGANELGAQFRSGPSDDPIHLQSRAIEDRLASRRAPDPVELQEDPPLTRLREAWADVSAVNRLWRTAPLPVDVPLVAPPSERRVGDEGEPWPDQMLDPDVRGRAAAGLHRRGVELASSVGEGFGFRTAFFWQPFLYSKEPVAGEEKVAGSWGTHPESWATAYETARAGLHPSVVDLGDALDDSTEPLYYDFVHTNERGAELLGQALYDQLRPTLVALAREGS